MAIETMRLNITIRARENNDGQRTIGFTADGLASIANGTVISTVSGYNSDSDDLAIIEFPVESEADRDYITGWLDSDERVIGYR